MLLVEVAVVVVVDVFVFLVVVVSVANNKWTPLPKMAAINIKHKIYQRTLSGAPKDNCQLESYQQPPTQLSQVLIPFPSLSVSFPPLLGRDHKNDLKVFKIKIKNKNDQMNKPISNLLWIRIIKIIMNNYLHFN